MSTIHYAVEITTDITGTDVAYGLVGGVFRFITDRPGYDGAPVYPKNEDNSNNTYTWYEGWLLKDGLDNPNRRVDISQTGDYGTLSGFTFKIRNDTKFWEFIEDNDIFLCNRSVKLYTVIDDKFYQIWDGVISNQPYSETDYQFVCVDKFKTVHKEMPPTTVNETNNPDADRESLGSVVPITFGNVQYAKLVKLSNTKTKIGLISGGAPQVYDSYDSAQAISYDINIGGDWHYYTQVILLIRGVTFRPNELVGKYLFVVSGIHADTSRGIKIIAHTTTTVPGSADKHLMLGLSEPLANVIPYEFNNSSIYKYTDAGTTADTWWFQIVDFTTTVSASTNSVAGFVRDPVTNKIKIYKYDETSGSFSEFQDVMYARIELCDRTTSISLYANSINEDGQIEIISPIPFTSIHSELYDYNQSTYTHTLRNLDIPWTYGAEIPLRIPDGYDYSNCSAIYCCPDFSVYKAGVSPNQAFNMRMRYEAYDVYGKKMTYLCNDVDLYVDARRGYVGGSKNYYLFVPPDYYRTRNQTLGLQPEWGKYGITSSGDVGRLGDICKMNTDMLEALKNRKISRIAISFGFQIIQTGHGISMTGFDFDLFEIGLFTTKFIDTVQGDLYGAVSGESNTDGATTGNVYGAMRLMMETYDGISPTQIDYGNLATTRSDWPVSRQMTEKKNSYDYIRELAEQSFVTVFPTRTGKRKLSAWRENETVVAAHTEATIVRDSISSFIRTDLKDLFNDFVLEYAYNPGTKKFERSLAVRNADQTTFPDITAVVPAAVWTDYVNGVNPTSYADAQIIWGLCHRAYLKSKATQKIPETLGKLSWYTDSSSITTGPSVGCSVDDSPWKFLNGMAEWCTRQKEIVTYKLPLSAANLVLELVDHLTFSDAIYTSNIARPGWITYIEVDIKNDQIMLEATLNPAELAFDAVIIERGIYLNIDTYTEGIVQPDTFSEPQQIPLT